jgi:hypothetical protein
MGLLGTGMETRTVAQARGDGGVSRGSCAGFGEFCGGVHHFSTTVCTRLSVLVLCVRAHTLVF